MVERAVAGVAGLSLLLLLGPLGSAGAARTHLRPIGCQSLPTDPPLTAPLYAQKEGARGTPNGWWCQLPHATSMVSGLTALRREVAPAIDQYATFGTVYGPKGSKPTASIPVKPRIDVVVVLDSSVTPPARLKHRPRPRGGSRIDLGHQVQAVVVTYGKAVRVTWPYPVKGVPKYLRGVATIVVTGTGVSKGTVIAVARKVAPD